jgi:hypothetical protein
MRVLALLVFLFIAPVAAAAEDWGPPTADYSTTLTFTDGRGRKLEHHMYFTAQRQRLDYKVGDRAEATIVDLVEAAVFVLYPEQKKYRKEPLVTPEFDLGIGRAATKREKLGEEEVAGHRANKFRVEAKTAGGQVFSGLAWLTPERILVKLDGEVRQGKLTRHITMVASDLKIGPIDPAVFRIPAAYTRIEDRSP